MLKCKKCGNNTFGVKVVEKTFTPYIMVDGKLDKALGEAEVLSREIENSYFCFQCKKEYKLEELDTTSKCVVCGTEFEGSGELCEECNKEKERLENKSKDEIIEMLLDGNVNKDVLNYIREREKTSPKKCVETNDKNIVVENTVEENMTKSVEYTENEVVEDIKDVVSEENAAVMEDCNTEPVVEEKSTEKGEKTAQDKLDEIMSKINNMDLKDSLTGLSSKSSTVNEKQVENLQENFNEEFGDDIELNISETIDSVVEDNVNAFVDESINENINQNIDENIDSTINETITETVEDNIEDSVDNTINETIDDNIEENIKDSLEEDVVEEDSLEEDSLEVDIVEEDVVEEKTEKVETKENVKDDKVYKEEDVKVRDIKYTEEDIVKKLQNMSLNEVNSIEL